MILPELKKKEYKGLKLSAIFGIKEKSGRYFKAYLYP